MDKKRTHWTTKYLKRINSTEVTLKRCKTEKVKIQRRRLIRIETEPVFMKTQEEILQRTPDRVVYTPKRTLIYISPNENISIPPTPYSTPEEYIVENRSRKRLFS